MKKHAGKSEKERELSVKSIVNNLYFKREESNGDKHQLYLYTRLKNDDNLETNEQNNQNCLTYYNETFTQSNFASQRFNRTPIVRLLFKVKIGKRKQMATIIIFRSSNKLKQKKMEKKIAERQCVSLQKFKSRTPAITSNTAPRTHLQPRSYNHRSCNDVATITCHLCQQLCVATSPKLCWQGQKLCKQCSIPWPVLHYRCQLKMWFQMGSRRYIGYRLG